MAAVSELEQPAPPEEKNNAAAVLALSPVLWLPAVAERYERREKLGHGMFGDVYKAWDRVLERVVAVKRLSGRTDDDRFEREVMSLAACRGHPSVVQILATYADRSRPDGDCFIVTEYAGPRNLREYMQSRRLSNDPFDEGEVRDAMEQLLAGARHAHMAGVLHRNIVPENVIVNDTASGRMVCKICGFGMSAKPVARKADKDDDYGLLASSSSYRAPELFSGSKDYDDRVDTWSLGYIMAELIACGPLLGVLPVVGTEGNLEWQRLDRVVERVAPPAKVALGIKEGGHQGFPPQRLSTAGFKVLKGLLDSNPERRLSAAAALSKRWFRRRCLFGAWCFMPHGGVAP